MPGPEEVEEILARLMPAALSEEGESCLLDSIGQLAEEAGLAVGRPNRRVWPWGLGAAAAVALACLALFRGEGDSAITERDSEPEPASVVQLAHSDLVESIKEEGWHEDQHGAAHQAVRVKVVDRREFLDSETGIRMTVTEPREELLLVPVSAF